MLRAAEGRCWEWVVPSVALEEVKRAHLVSGTLRRSDGVHLRIVADARRSMSPSSGPTSGTSVAAR